MIRPLEYCLTLPHLEASIATIDQRILELLDLREKYDNQAKSLQQENEKIEFKKKTSFR